jgi:hypothetical protein
MDPCAITYYHTCRVCRLVIYKLVLNCDSHWAGMTFTALRDRCADICPSQFLFRASADDDLHCSSWLPFRGQSSNSMHQRRFSTSLPPCWKGTIASKLTTEKRGAPAQRVKKISAQRHWFKANYAAGPRGSEPPHGRHSHARRPE